MRRFFYWVLAAVALIGAMPANAADYWATFWGEYNLVFKFPNVNPVNPEDWSDGTDYYLEGGIPAYIGGQHGSHLIDGSGLSEMLLDIGPGGTKFYISSDDNAIGGEASASFSTPKTLFSFQPDEGPGSSLIDYRFKQGDIASGSFNYIFSPTLPGSATFAINRFTLTSEIPVGAVPEPATWAMMILGFAAMGVALRRKRFITRTPHTAAR